MICCSGGIPPRDESRKALWGKRREYLLAPTVLRDADWVICLAYCRGEWSLPVFRYPLSRPICIRSSRFGMHGVQNDQPKARW
jgi:hypothetical protein